MLILSRKTNESIIINGNIEVKVMVAEDGKVRIGIDAPREVVIHRKEIFDKIMEENKKAAGSKAKVSKINGIKMNNARQNAQKLLK